MRACRAQKQKFGSFTLNTGKRTKKTGKLEINVWLLTHSMENVPVPILNALHLSGAGASFEPQ